MLVVSVCVSVSVCLVFVCLCLPPAESFPLPGAETAATVLPQPHPLHTKRRSVGSVFLRPRLGTHRDCVQIVLAAGHGDGARSH